MTRKGLLSIVDAAYLQSGPTPPSGEAFPSLLDLSIRDGQIPPDSTEWRAGISVPLNKPENVSLLGVKQAVRTALAGRLPDTYFAYKGERFVVGYAIYGTSDASLREVGTFAMSLTGVLAPMVAEQPRLRLAYHGHFIGDILLSPNTSPA